MHFLLKVLLNDKNWLLNLSNQKKLKNLLTNRLQLK